MIETKKNIEVDSLALSFGVIAMLIPTLIYPFVYSNLAWQIAIIITICAIILEAFRYKNLQFKKCWTFWIITIFPVVYNSVALKLNEMGFFVIWIVLVALLSQVGNNSRWIMHALRIIGILTCLYAFSTIIFNIYPSPLLRNISLLFRRRIQAGTLESAGLTSHYSHNGMYIALGSVLWFSVMLYSKKIKHIVLFILFIIALLLTLKRGPLVAVAIAVFFTYYIAQRGSFSKRINKLFLFLLVLIFAACILYVIAPSVFAVFDRFLVRDNVLSNRERLWKYAIECFKSSPLLGHGWGYYSHSISLNIDTVRVVDMNAHNIYLQLLAETGIVGFICFMLPMSFSFLMSLKVIKFNRSLEAVNNMSPMYFSVAMQMFFFVYGLTGNPLYDKQAFVPYMIAVAITIYYYQDMLKVQTSIEENDTDTDTSAEYNE